MVPTIKLSDWNESAGRLGNPFYPCSVIRVWAYEGRIVCGVPHVTAESMALAHHICCEALLLAINQGYDFHGKMVYPAVSATKWVAQVDFPSGWESELVLGAIQRAACDTKNNQTWPTYKIEVKL